jgi:hypothetical protein
MYFGKMRFEMRAGRILCFVVVAFAPLFLYAQSETPATGPSIYQIAFDSAVSTLNREQLAVYTGREYYPYFIKETGKYAVTSVTAAGSRPGEHPFFISDDFRSEMIEFEGTSYRSISLAFDICRGELVVLSPKQKAIVLPDGKVQKFTCAGHSFRALNTKGLRPDFYDVLVWRDSASLVVRRWKKQSELWHTISDYYVIRSGQAYPVSLITMKTVGVRAAVLEIFTDQKDIVRTYIRQNRLKFSPKKREKSLIKVVEYYASLKTK